MVVGALILGGAGGLLVQRQRDKPRTAAAPKTAHTIAAVRRAPAPVTPHASAPSVPVEASTATAEQPPPLIPTKEDWAEMAKTGGTRFCMPVAANWRVLDMPSAAAHADELDAAYTRSRRRLQEAFAPMCPEVAGGDVPKGVALLMRCGVGVMRASGADGAKAARTEIDELRAGMRPMPAASDGLKPEARVILALTGEAPALIDDLSKFMTRDEAEKIVFRPNGCAWQNGYEM
jgi:hypothetical protein